MNTLKKLLKDSSTGIIDCGRHDIRNLAQVVLEEGSHSALRLYLWRSGSSKNGV